MLSEFWNSLNLLKKLYDKTMEPVCQEFQLTRMELDILLFLANNPPFDTAADIIRRRRLTKSHVSSSLKLLEEKGYLQGEFHPGNRKTVHLRLCSQAGAPVSRGQEAQKEFAQAIFRNFTEKEKEEMDAAFFKIADNIRFALLEEGL